MTDPTHVIAPRRQRPPTLPLHVLTDEEIAERVKVALPKYGDGRRRLLIEVDELTWVEPDKVDRLWSLCTLSKQVRRRTDEDRRQRRPFNTGQVKGYYGAPIGPITLPNGKQGVLQIKLEVVAWEAQEDTPAT